MTTIYDLAKHPAAQQRLVEQVDAFFASRPNHNLSYEDLEHFSYLEAAFNVGPCLTHLPHSGPNGPCLLLPLLGTAISWRKSVFL